MLVLDAARDRRQRHEVQVRRQEHGAPGGQDGHVHAEAAVPGQRLGHARTRACGRTTRTCSGTRSATRDLGHRALVHRRADRTCAVAVGRTASPRTHAAGWSRATGRHQPRVLAAEPQARACGSAVLQEPRREAAQVRTPNRRATRTGAGAGDAHGRARRREEQDRAARADRQGPVRPAPEEALGQAVPARSRRCSTRSRPTTSGCSRAECSRRT